MVSTHADWKLGETRGAICEKIPAIAVNALEAGDFVFLANTSTATEGLVRVSKHTGSPAPFGVALYDAAAGETVQILTRGVVKVTFGGSAQDGPISATNNRAVAGGTAPKCGWNISGSKGAGETGIILFVNSGASS